jgi:hypothetical protein
MYAYDKQHMRIHASLTPTVCVGLNRVLKSSQLCHYFSLEADFERRI